MFKPLHDPVDAKVNCLLREHTVAVLNLFSAKAIHLELDQEVPLERREECLPSAIVQEIVQNGNALEGGLGYWLTAVHVCSEFVLAHEGALFPLCPTERRFSQASRKSDRQEGRDVFDAGGYDEFHKKGENLLRNILRFELSEAGTYLSISPMDGGREG